MVRVIVHPGLHKTGTSSLQSYLSQHRAVLSPYLTYFGKGDFPAAGTAARTYATRPFAWRLRAFRRHFDAFLADIPDEPVIVISRETFSGAMPGHRRITGRQITGYHRTAVPLGRQIIAALRARFGPDTHVTFVYTLRARESWIRSIYGHLLRSIHLRCDFDAFRAGLRGLADPEDEARRIAADLDLDDACFVTLDAVGCHSEGPASVILHLAGVPDAVRDALPPAIRTNTGQSRTLEAAFLKMNQGRQDKRALKRRKDAMIRQARDDARNHSD